MTKVIAKIFVFFFMPFLASSKSSITCPQCSWTEYKAAVEGPWSFMIERDSGKLSEEFSILRYTQYRCSDDNEVQFNTSRNGIVSSTQWAHSEYQPFRYFSRSCEQECNSQNVTLQVGFRNKGNNRMLYLLKQVTYLYKNCDKLYWTNWIETTNCSLSHHRNYVRYCEDCDGDEVDEKHCNGNSTTQKDCQYFWSSWIEGNCIVTKCNPTVWERARTRKCLYGNGSETINYGLCSNNSAIATEQCKNNTLPIKCSTNTVSGTESDNSNLYIGIGVALILMAIFFILLAVVLYHRRKCQINSTPNQNPNTHDLPVTPSIATASNKFGSEQSVIPYQYDCEQMPSSHEYELKQPVERPIYDNFQPRFSGANKRGQLFASHAFEMEQSDVPSANELEQREKLDEYESNMPHGANLPTVSHPTYPTVRKNGKSTEENNEYSSLASTISATESEYSKLSPQ